jgi:hypothetical protein
MPPKPEPPGIPATYKPDVTEEDLHKARVHAVEIMQRKGFCGQDMLSALDMLGLLDD